jgi:hypothetical protein
LGWGQERERDRYPEDTSKNIVVYKLGRVVTRTRTWLCHSPGVGVPACSTINDMPPCSWCLCGSQADQRRGLGSRWFASWGLFLICTTQVKGQ